MAGMPSALNAALQRLTAEADGDALARDAAALSEAYRTRTGSGARLLTQKGEAIAYAAARMPATYAAAQAALSWALDASGLVPDTLLDCGAGTGAVAWAAAQLLPLTEITCMEREAAMREVGAALMCEGSAALAGAKWAAFDMTAGEPLPPAALVCEGYMLGELAAPMRVPAAERLWAAAKEMLLLIEPGTPQGFANLAAVRRALTAQGAYVAAPCPGGSPGCPMEGEDWCHFAVRVPRTRLHKALKGGQAAYEDEKFAYLALTRRPPASPCEARVLRHPQIAPGRIALTLCAGGEKRACVVTKKDPLWKRARKMDAGEGI